MSDKNFSKNINIRKVVANEKFHLMFAKFEIYFKDKDEVHLKWVITKLRHIQSKSLTLHMWNSHSQKLQVEKWSIVNIIIKMEL